MKKAGIALISILVLALALAGCSGGDDPSSSSSSAPAPSSSAPASSQSGSGGSGDASGSDLDVAGMLGTLVEAAALGGTIEVTELDLKANGISVDKLVDWAGAEAKTSAENGGYVLVLVTQPGAAEDLVKELEALRDARASDDRYAEFEVARENTAKARIVTDGDCVFYAVATTADAFTAVDAAIAELP